MRTAVLAVAKLENNYIREWVEYYKNLGFSNIILYDNNDDNGERVADVIRDYIDEGFVILEEFFGIDKAQFIVYGDGYAKYGKDYDWIAVFDIDEYLVINEKYNNNIANYLSCGLFDDADIIRISWRIMDDNDLLTVKDNDYSLFNRFTRPAISGKQCDWTKGIVKGGLNLKIPSNNNTSHMVCIGGINKAVDANGRQIPNTNIMIGCDYSNAALNHYCHKTIEEFVKQKMKKGWGVDLDKNIINKNMFFVYNIWTQEKEDLYNKLTKELYAK